MGSVWNVKKKTGTIIVYSGIFLHKDYYQGREGPVRVNIDIAYLEGQGDLVSRLITHNPYSNTYLSLL